jgi:hypothetical protein
MMKLGTGRNNFFPSDFAKIWEKFLLVVGLGATALKTPSRDGLLTK